MVYIGDPPIKVYRTTKASCRAARYRSRNSALQEGAHTSHYRLSGRCQAQADVGIEKADTS